MTLIFIKGAGHSMSIQKYNYTDKEVSEGNEYHYRLRQLDYDGSTSCTELGKTFTIKYESKQNNILESCMPNPMTDFTRIKYFINEESNVTLEIIDLLGNVVRTIVNDNSIPGYHEETWDGTDNSGIPVSSGTYLVKLTNSGRFFTGIITVNR